MSTRNWMLGIVFVLASGIASAVTPPDLINYQGVLRDATGSPIDDTREMVFRFYDADGGGSCVGGTLLLTDGHTGSGDVTITRGQFNVQLGSGVITPGTVGTLTQAFSENDAVWVEVEVESEILCPRIRIASAAYSLNSAKLDGHDPLFYLDASSTKQTKNGPLEIDSTTVVDSTGIKVTGELWGGSYHNASGDGWVTLSTLGSGISAWGSTHAGYFSAIGASGRAYIGILDGGVEAYGDSWGGYFKDGDGSGYSYVGYGDRGIQGYGNSGGGVFVDLDGSGWARVGYNDDGIQAHGTRAGGYFEDDDATAYAWLAYGTYGIDARGTAVGGFFYDQDNTGQAYVGYGDRGIEARGDGVGGYFEDSAGGGHVYAGYGGLGVSSYGGTAGGYFEDTNGSGVAYLGFGDQGIEAWGDTYGGDFHDTDNGTYVMVADGTTKISGNGSGTSFIQNHPYDSSRVIVYSAPEGDEVATYTRGSARLVDGRAVVRLGETFEWVTNPDVGLTAHLTPRGREAVALAVESLSTQEMVVRGPRGSDTEFDFIVYGLRIGFEEVSVIEEKEQESFIPSMKDHRMRYQRSPELRKFNALERFRKMRMAAGRDSELDLSAANALKTAIVEFDPEIHAQQFQPPSELSNWEGSGEPEAMEIDIAVEEATVEGSNERGYGSANIAGRTTTVHLQERPAAEYPATSFPVDREVEEGQLLVLDPAHPGSLRPCDTTGDRTVVGIAVAEPSEIDGQLQVEVALHGVVDLKVDAAYGSILPGDLLTTSPTAGHAMLAIAPSQGSVAAKALEGLDSGTGTIRALVIHQ